MAAKIIATFGDFFLPKKTLKMRDVLEKMRDRGKIPNLRDFPHDCGMVDTYVHCIIYLNANRVRHQPDEALGFGHATTSG